MRVQARKGWYRVGVAMTASFFLVLLALGWTYLDQHDYFSESVRARKCGVHLQRIDAAKSAMHEAGELPTGREPALNEILDWVEGGTKSLQCPSGGTYTLGVPPTPARCSRHSSP